MPRAPSSLIAADLLRFACAMGVAAYHLFTQLWRFPSHHAATALSGVAPPAAGWIEGTRFGWVGVELFFVISGFMIVRSVRCGNVGLFLRRRLLRLAPAVWVCATITAALLLAIGDEPAIGARWAGALLFLPWTATIDPSYWTLGIELSFYLLVATAAEASDIDRRCDRIAALLAGGSLLFWAIFTLRYRGEFVAVARPEQLLLLCHGGFFAIGMMVARLHDFGVQRRFLLIAAIAAAAGWLEIGQHSVEQATLLGRAPDPLVPASLVGAGIALLAFAPQCQRALERMIGLASARLLGLATYPLYLIHQVVGASIAGALAHAGVPAAVAILATIACLLLVAMAIAHWVEPVVRRRFGQVLDMLAALARPSRARVAGDAHAAWR